MARLTYRGAVYPWQCDHMGHMNVMWYVGKMDEASHNLFASIGVTGAYMRERGAVLGAVQQNIAYRREVLAGDTVEVHSRVLEVREKVIRFEHEMRAAASQLNFERAAELRDKIKILKERQLSLA